MHRTDWTSAAEQMSPEKQGAPDTTQASRTAEQGERRVPSEEAEDTGRAWVPATVQGRTTRGRCVLLEM